MNASTPVSPPRLRRRGILTVLTVALLTACTGHVSQEAPEHEEGKTAATVTETDAPLPEQAPPSAELAEHLVDLAQVSNGIAAEDAMIAGEARQGASAPVAPAPASREMHRAQFYSLATSQVAPMVAPPQGMDRERYAAFDDNGVRVTAAEPVSTFSIDVDTGAYSNMRRYLTSGMLPPSDAVRVEELINYFSYQYPLPSDQDTPFRVNTQVAPTPWDPDKLLMQIGIKGFEVPASERPASNLVFLIDVSGSMGSTNKLPLLKQAFALLTDNLNDRDRVAIVVYAGASGVVLEPTAGDDAGRIAEALERLHAGGSTNGASGIRLAYQTARSAFIEGGINRVILATDGDFNVGIADTDRLVNLVERERENGVSLTTLGFGTGNYNDHLMEQLADAGNGNYAYIDTLREARKVLVSELGATLHTIASDVKIQVEFNPSQVAEYRLIGYENRALNREDFNNDKVDAGEIGAGHTVTALYELTPVDSPARRVDPLRYGEQAGATSAGHDELAFLKLRYKQPGNSDSILLEYPIDQAQVRSPQETDEDFRFAAAVAAFGQQLRGGLFIGDYALDETLALASGALGDDRHGYRHEFLGLVEQAKALWPAERNAVGQVQPGHGIGR